MTTSVYYASAHGWSLKLEVHLPAFTQWHAVPGVYLFCTGPQLSRISPPLYVGQAESFRDRLTNHEQWESARRLGATHIMAVIVQDPRSRSVLERSLIEEFNPRLNTQLRTAAPGMSVGGAGQAMLRGLGLINALGPDPLATPSLLNPARRGSLR